MPNSPAAAPRPAPPYEEDEPKSRVLIQRFAWVGVLIGLLHVFEGRSMGILQILLSTLGIYASWENVTSRMKFLLTYTVGCFIWTVVESLLLIAMFASRSRSMSEFLSNLIASNTFTRLLPLLEKMFEQLNGAASWLILFISCTGVIFNMFCTYLAFSLYYDALEIIFKSETRLPLLRPSIQRRPPISGFGSVRGFNQPPPPQRPPVNPFEGRGHRLGSS